MVARHDAVSTAVYDTYRTLSAEPDLEVALLTLRNDYPDVPADIIGGVADLLLHRAFLSADVLIYHFALYNELFNALLVGGAHAAQVVRFHNITPIDFANQEVQPVIAASYNQLRLLSYSDEVWADSLVNARALAKLDIYGPAVCVIPLIVDGVSPARLATKPSEKIEILFIGRIVKSKGVLDLVNALARVPIALQQSMRLRIVYNLEWSDTRYMEEVRAAIALHGLESIVKLYAGVDDDRRQHLFHAAHILAIPSFHEGFCKPVVEGLCAGCVPLGYAAYNLPTISAGFGRMVAPGDIDALSEALADLASSLRLQQVSSELAMLPLDRGPTSVHEFEHRVAGYVTQFSRERLAPVVVARVRGLLAMGRGATPGLPY